MRITNFSTRHPVLVLFAALGLGTAAAFMSTGLRLQTSFSELLPNDDPGVVTLEKTQKRMGDLSLLLVGIRSPDPAASERYAEALTQHLLSLPKGVCDFAAYHMRDVHAFFAQNRWLYASEDALTDLRDRLRREIARQKNPLFVDLSDDDEESDKALQAKLDRAEPFAGRFPGGLFKTTTNPTLWVAALPSGGIMVSNPGEALLAATRDFVAHNPAAKFHPSMDVELTGPAITPVRNREALSRDLFLVAILCTVLIPLSVLLYFRRVRAVVLIFAPATLATLMAYGFAYVVFGYLTTVTSFLVSFIMGNGTNYAVILLARYEEKRGAGSSARDSIQSASAELWRTTGVATIASAISYLALLVTSFRGFSQFGMMGAAGCLLAWLCTFTLLPALAVLMDRRTLVPKPEAEASKMLRWLGGRLTAWRVPVLAVSGVVTVAMMVGATHFRNDPFEYDFRKLSTPNITDQRTRKFDQEKDELFGRWPQPTVVLADAPEDVAPLRQAIRKADLEAKGNDVIGEMYALNDLLPGTPEQQEAKLALIAQIRHMTEDPALQVLEPAEREKIEKLHPPNNLRVVSQLDLPPLARRPFTEADGAVGRVLLVYPPEKGLSVWDGRALLRTAAVIQKVTLADGRTVSSSGGAVIFASMIRSVLRDGPIATITSLLAVLLLVLVRVRPLKAALFVMGGLMVGVCWMIGIAGWLGIKITFLNFIALPFIFGVGVEYAIHMVDEYRHTGSIVKTVISGGGPVALCAWSAILGYGTLLIARNGALRGLGGLASLGEITCLLAAVMVVPLAMSLTRCKPPATVREP